MIISIRVRAMPANLIEQIVEKISDDEVEVRGVGKPKRIKLPSEVVEWLLASKAAVRALDELIGHYKFRIRLSHPGAIRSLILLLYARYHNTAPYKVARKYGVAPEQLYRLERGMRRDGLLSLVLNLFSLETGGKPY